MQNADRDVLWLRLHQIIEAVDQLTDSGFAADGIKQCCRHDLVGLYESRDRITVIVTARGIGVSDHTTAVKTLLEDYFDHGNAAALDQACLAAKNSATDIAELLRWLLSDAVAEPEVLDLATRRLRHAMGLQMMPGAVCRPTPKF